MESGELDSSGERAARAARLRRLALRLDSEPALLTAAERLRHHLPGDAQFGDPLSTAGPQPFEVLARRVSALQPERQSVVKELGMAGLQVWQALSEKTGRGHGERSMAILFTDLVGFSRWALDAGDTAVLMLLRDVGTAVEAPIVRHGGRIVKRLGDGLMATFLAARPAVDAALEAQEAVARVELEGFQARLRAGVHWGSPRRLGGDYLGVDVNVAVRIMEAARPGHVLVSGALLAQIDPDGLKVGSERRLRAEGAPRDLHVSELSRP